MRRLLLLLPGLALLIAGFVVVATHRTVSDFGWFAYTPLSDDDVLAFGGATLLSNGALVGWALAAVGLAVLALGAGYLLGRRAGARSAA